jgi:hypothetical protein
VLVTREQEVRRALTGWLRQKVASTDSHQKQ